MNPSEVREKSKARIFKLLVDEASQMLAAGYAPEVIGLMGDSVTDVLELLVDKLCLLQSPEQQTMFLEHIHARVVLLVEFRGDIRLFFEQKRRSVVA